MAQRIKELKANVNGVIVASADFSTALNDHAKEFQKRQFTELETANRRIKELTEALNETDKDLCILWGQMIDIEKTNPQAEGMHKLIQSWRDRNNKALKTKTHE